MILWYKPPVYGQHSIHEYEELFQNDQPIVLDEPDHEWGFDTFDAFLVVFNFACAIGTVVILLMFP